MFWFNSQSLKKRQNSRPGRIYEFVFGNSLKFPQRSTKNKEKFQDTQIRLAQECRASKEVNEKLTCDKNKKGENNFQIDEICRFCKIR